MRLLTSLHTSPALRKYVYRTRCLNAAVSNLSLPVVLESPAVLSDVHRDFTDPFDETRDVFYGIHSQVSLMIGPWKARIPISVVAGEEFTMQFICTSPEPSFCPPYYMVLFHGPTKLSVTPEAFDQLNWTHSAPGEHAVVNAKFVIHDPGHYRVFAYPQFMKCDHWMDLQYPWHSATVQDCSLEITVIGKRPPPVEGYGICTTEQIDNGRYLSVNASPEFSSLYSHTNRSYIYAPYNCKIPHRTFLDAIKALPTAKHFAYFGDSTMRSPFCSRVWENLHGTVEDSLCDYLNSPMTYNDNKWGHKTVLCSAWER